MTPAHVIVLCTVVGLACMSSWSRAQNCGGTLANSSMTLETPGYPGRYPGGLVCQWWVQQASNSVCGLELRLSSGALAPCPSTLLEVGGSPVCGGPPGSLLHVPFIPPQTLVTFRGDPEGGEGMQIFLQQEDCSSSFTSSSCGGEFSGETVQILSPGYPQGYPAGADCSYIIKRTDPTVCQVQLTFHQSSLEKSVNCHKDSLKIHDDLLCGDLLGVRNYGIDNDFEIRFKTDFEKSDKGFNLTVRQIRCGDTPPIEDYDQDIATDKQDVVDCNPGYPRVQTPYLAFPIGGSNGNDLPPEYFPPYNNNKFTGRYPVEASPPVVPPYRQNYPSFSPSIPYRPGTYQPTQKGPVYYNPPTRTYPSTSQNIPLYNSRPNIWPVQPATRQGFTQCCGQVYSDSHFLIVSPGFPRSSTSDCIYTINRYSPLTSQLRLQFRYFWAGEDTGTGCSGGYLEIDGTRVCGCKTGTVWTSLFYESETTKILRLKLDYPFDRLFNGFVIEVLQDDSYSQRNIRASEVEDLNNSTVVTGGRSSNFSQFVETIVERYPVTVSQGFQPLVKSQYQNPNSELVDESKNQRIWDSSSRQSQDLFCLRWNWQDWILLVKEVLWSKYQCSSSSSSSTSTSGIFRSDIPYPYPQYQPQPYPQPQPTDPCRSCFYFCPRSCQCC